MFKNIYLSYAYGYWSGPCTPGSKDLKEGKSFKSEGIEISSDHKSLTLEPYICQSDIMKCIVIVDGNKSEVVEKITIDLSNVRSPVFIQFDNGWDDAAYSIHNLTLWFRLNRWLKPAKQPYYRLISRIRSCYHSLKYTK